MLLFFLVGFAFLSKHLMDDVRYILGLVFGVFCWFGYRGLKLNFSFIPTLNSLVCDALRCSGCFVGVEKICYF